MRKSLTIIIIVFLILFHAGCKKSVTNGSDNNHDDIPDDTPEITYTLVCEVDTEGYGIGIDGETGSRTTEYHGESTIYGTNDDGQSTITVNINRTVTYGDTGNVYEITGVIVLNEATNTVEWEISATGGAFGDEVKTCKGP